MLCARARARARVCVCVCVFWVQCPWINLWLPFFFFFLTCPSLNACLCFILFSAQRAELWCISEVDALQVFLYYLLLFTPVLYWAHVAAGAVFGILFFPRTNVNHAYLLP